jgi:hypothetical protein
MPQNPQEVTNPDLVDVADQGDGPLVLEQTVTVGPTQVSGRTVEGGTYSPEKPGASYVVQDDVVLQVFGSTYPANVFV